MLASERLLEIEEKFEAKVERIVPVELDEETLRVVLYLKDDPIFVDCDPETFCITVPQIESAIEAPQRNMLAPCSAKLLH